MSRLPVSARDDASGKPVAGLSIRSLIESGTGRLPSSHAPTDFAGRMTVRFRPGPGANAVRLSATYRGEDVPGGELLVEVEGR